MHSPPSLTPSADLASIAAANAEQHALLQMNIAKAHAMPFQKLPKLLTLVDSLTTTSAGDLFALLKARATERMQRSWAQACTSSVSST